MAANASILEIIQTVCDELGLVRPATITNSTDLQTRQLLSLANRELKELQQDKQWTALQTEANLHVTQPIITTGDTTLNSYQITNIPSTTGIIGYLFVCNAGNIPVAARVTQINDAHTVTLDEPATGTQVRVSCNFAQDTYPLPPDFSRFINQTWWDRTNRWALLGPDSPQVDQWHRSGVVTIGPRRHFRQIGPQIPQGYGGDFGADFNSDFNTQGSSLYAYRLWPPPGATDTPIDIAYEYISNYPVIGALVTPQPTFVADADFPVLDSNMILMGVKWRFFQIKGFDYQPLQQEHIDYVDRAYANDGGAKTLSLSPTRMNLLIQSSNVQDGNWPGNNSST